jgi:hypothetical protein
MQDVIMALFSPGKMLIHLISKEEVVIDMEFFSMIASKSI